MLFNSLHFLLGFLPTVLAGFILSPLLGVPPITSGGYSIATILVSLLGAVVLLAIVNLVRRGSVR